METRAEQNIRIFILGEILIFQYLFSSKIRMEMLKYLWFQRMNMFSATLTLKWIWQRCYNISWELLLTYFVLRTVLTRDISFGLLNQNCKKNAWGQAELSFNFCFLWGYLTLVFPLANEKNQKTKTPHQTKKKERKENLDLFWKGNEFCKHSAWRYSTVLWILYLILINGCFYG